MLWGTQPTLWLSLFVWTGSTAYSSIDFVTIFSAFWLKWYRVYSITLFIEYCLTFLDKCFFCEPKQSWFFLNFGFCRLGDLLTTLSPPMFLAGFGFHHLFYDFPFLIWIYWRGNNKYLVSSAVLTTLISIILLNDSVKYNSTLIW